LAAAGRIAGDAMSTAAIAILRMGVLLIFGRLAALLCKLSKA
jgi:hypothetical protein